MIAVTSSNDKLKTLIGKAGGNLSHYQLYSYLLSFSFNKEYFDTRAGQSILFILPSTLQLPLAILLHQKELELQRLFNIQESQIASPLETLILNLLVKEDTIGSIIASKLNEQDWGFFEDIYSLPQGFFSKDYFAGVEFLLNGHLDTVEFTQNVMSLITTNNRRQSSLLIAKALNYSDSIKEELLLIVDQWLHQNIIT